MSPRNSGLIKSSSRDMIIMTKYIYLRTDSGVGWLIQTWNKQNKPSALGSRGSHKHPEEFNLKLVHKM